MEIKLAENIRKFRKERSLTQEQLSEVLGVTAGAVYKWEAGLSIPDIGLIAEMADFFDTSVDVLLGYEMKDNRLAATVQRLREYRWNKDRTGLAAAEKALKKYPHSFEVVHESALLYRAFGIESGNRDEFRRALELLEQSRMLLPQNTDPKISEQTLYGKMAEMYMGLDKPEKALSLLKMHNAGGMYNHKIGLILSGRERTEEAVPFLSEGLVTILADLISTIIGYKNVFFTRSDYASARAILQWGIGLLSALQDGEKPDFLDKVNSGFLASLAFAQLKSGQNNEARNSLEKAKKLAASFDEAPNYAQNDIRFIISAEGESAYDDLGTTAMDAIENVVSRCKNEEFTALWKSVTGQEADRNDE
ncbi:MAG: helix-turn-helix transcriptional regulator [Flexilinea sp.]|nr:helix-turn-helix transcriptional regulator [Flexilinea sp.]